MPPTYQKAAQGPARPTESGVYDLEEYIDDALAAMDATGRESGPLRLLSAGCSVPSWPAPIPSA